MSRGIMRGSYRLEIDVRAVGFAVDITVKSWEDASIGLPVDGVVGSVMVVTSPRPGDVGWWGRVVALRRRRPWGVTQFGWVIRSLQGH